jgi:hypothetical protein
MGGHIKGLGSLSLGLVLQLGQYCHLVLHRGQSFF